MNARRAIGQPLAFALVCVLGVPSWVFIPLAIIIVSSHGVVDGWGWIALWCYCGAGTLSFPFAIVAWPFIAMYGTLSDRNLLYAAMATGIVQPFVVGAYRSASGHPALTDLLWAHTAALVCAFLGGTIAIGMARWFDVLPRPTKRGGHDQPGARPDVRHEVPATSGSTSSPSTHHVP